MAYVTEAIPIILNNIQRHLATASLFKCVFFVQLSSS